MKFQINHDYHIHSKLSSCSNRPEQTAENILKYAKENGLNEIVITDHLWDSNVLGASDWYEPQDFEHISEILPLPQGDGIKFRFGCETELDKNMTLGLSDKLLDKFEFIIIPTTHLHMTGFTIAEDDCTIEKRADVYVKRLDRLLDMDLPFNKIGIAHLTCPLLAPGEFENHLAVLDLISDDIFRELFAKLRDKGAGFELNFVPEKYSDTDIHRVLRPYKIAKEIGCKFYLGSDAHTPAELDGANKRFSDMVNLLNLEESDRFYIG